MWLARFYSFKRCLFMSAGFIRENSLSVPLAGRSQTGSVDHVNVHGVIAVFAIPFQGDYLVVLVLSFEVIVFILVGERSDSLRGLSLFLASTFPWTLVELVVMAKFEGLEGADSGSNP